MKPKITPCLWFDTEAEPAAAFYCSVFPNSRILSVSRYGEGGPREAGLALTVEFELDGVRFTALNGGPQFTFDEAVSFQIDCAGQDDVDHYWERLTEGGKEGRCGWCTDRFGLSWQVVPAGMGDILSNPDREAARRAMDAMMKMSKLDIGALRAAAEGAPAA
jgi:predicted 3-demethylubiquinone-9 3-methyltransferase (glyoxalase superfamily)